MPAAITLPYKLERALPPFEDYDPAKADKFPESLVRHYLEVFTEKGDKVFDPFMGLGTTAFICEETGRIPYGIEADTERAEWVAGQLENWTHVKNDDSARLLRYGFPKMDFVITSPPYMPRHHKWNPLFGGDPRHAGYDKYRKRMALIFARLAKIVKRNSYIVVQADNLKDRSFTPLVRDISLAAEKSFRLDDENIVFWDGGPEDYPYTHCLIFKNT